MTGMGAGNVVKIHPRPWSLGFSFDCTLVENIVSTHSDEMPLCASKTHSKFQIADTFCDKLVTTELLYIRSNVFTDLAIRLEA